METNLYSEIPYLSLVFACLMAMVLTIIILPSVRAISRRRSLYDFDISNEVTLSHIPKHAGIALAVSFSVASSVFAPVSLVPGLRYLLAALILLLAAGIQDDLMHLSSFLRMMLVVAAGSIITDVAGMRLVYTGMGRIFNYPLADLLATYGILVGFVLLLLQAVKIPGLLSLSLITGSLALAVSSIRSGLPGLAVAPLALAGSAAILFFSSLGRYVFEGRATALTGGFLLAILLISSFNLQDYHISFSSYIGVLLPVVLLPVLIASGFLKLKDEQLFLFGKKLNHPLSLLLLLVVLVLLIVLV